MASRDIPARDFWNSVAVMNAAIGRQMAATQKRCKKDYGEKVHWELQIGVSDGVYIDSLQHAAFGSD